jgi:hypothetical protein
MAKLNNLFHVLICLIALSFTVVGQAHDLTEQQFNEIKALAEGKLSGRTYRLTETTETFPVRDGAVESVRVHITEIVPPNERREVDDLKSPERTERTERIWDGKFLYERRDNGAWSKYDGGGSGSSDFTSGRVTMNYRLIEKTKINNDLVTIYEVEKHRRANKYTRDGLIEFHYIDKTKYWIGSDGSFIKAVQESEVVGGKWLVRGTSIYEYDPNIKIEAPIN